MIDLAEHSGDGCGYIPLDIYQIGIEIWNLFFSYFNNESNRKLLQRLAVAFIMPIFM